MQTKIIYALLLILPYTLLAQSPAQRDFMRNANNTAALNQLLQNVQAQNVVDQQLVELYALTNNVQIKEVLPDGRIKLLVRILPNNHPEYIITDNVSSATSIATNKVHTGELGFTLDGDGFYIGEWDGGDVLMTHESMVGRVQPYDLDGTSNHATHVGGTMIGDGTGNATAKGMAPKARIESWDFSDDDVEMIAEAAGTGQSPHAPFLVSNHSYGTVCGWSTLQGVAPRWAGDPLISTVEDYKFGWYSPDARTFDIIANNTPYYLIFKSAGNDRGDFADFGLTGVGGSSPILTADGTGETPGDGYDCVSTYSNAKNIMTVGAVEDVSGGYSGPSSVVMSSFSGWGPADDGRIKPDIVTNGVGLTSASHDGNNAYASLSGTSMATPSAAGSAILLQEHYSETHINQSSGMGELMLSSTLKALIINTADEAGNPGPDYSFGWGLMNTARAAQLISKDLTLDDHIIEETLVSGTTYMKDVCVGGNEPLKVTLAWNDPAATATPVDGDVLDNPTPKLINDLDLRITNANGTTVYEPWILNKDVPSAPATRGDNFLDNVEQVYVENLPAGVYTLTVTNKGTLTADQSFSLIMTGINNADAAADAGVIDIQDIPNGTICQNGMSVCPTITVQNFTCNELADLTVNYRINGGATTSFDLGQSLSAGEIVEVYLGDIQLSPGAGQTFEAWTSLLDGLVDVVMANDGLTNTFTLTQPSVTTDALPLAVDFSDNSVTNHFTLDNPDGLESWITHDHTDCPRGISAEMNNYNYEAQGQADGMVSPLYDFSNLSSLTLTFDLAYAPLSTSSFEALEVRIQDACGSSAVTAWSRAGLGLSTNGGGGLGTGSYQGATPRWVPACEDWATVTVDLSDYIGQIASIGIYNINGYGNDLFIDDVNISSTTCPDVTPVASLVGGGNACSSFDLTSTSAPNGYTYQWFKNGNPVVGATDQNFTAPGGGDYTVAFVGVCKFPASAAISVVADVNPPNITTDCSTLNQSVDLNENCELVVPNLTGGIAATDDCDTDIDITQNPIAGTVLSSGHQMTHPITIMATDDGGLTSTCEVVLTANYNYIEPTTSPFEDCESTVTNVDLDADCMWTVPEIQGLDEVVVCGRTYSFVQIPAAGTKLLGTHNGNPTVTIKYEDQDDVAYECILPYSTQDVTNPMIITDCATLNQTIDLDGSCQILIPDFRSLITATDNCSSSPTITQNPTAGVIASGHNMTHDITITATDAAGLTATCTITLTGKDVTNPSIETDCSTLNQNVTLDNNCEFIVPNLTSSITTMDNCSNVTVTQDPNMGTTVSSGHNMTHDITITATDAAGLTDVCTIVLTGNDVDAPSISTDCSTLDRNVNLNGNCEVIVPDLTGSITANDNCNTIISQDPAANSALASGNDMTHLVVITVTDDAGSTHTCEVTLTGKNVAQPIYEPGCTSVGPEVDLNSSCEIVIPDLTTITTGGTCGNTYTITQEPTAGEVMTNASHNMTYDITVTATDQNSMSSSCEITITAKDRTHPVINDMPNDLDRNVNFIGNTCNIIVPDLSGELSITEDCSNPVTVTQVPNANESLTSAHNMTHTVILTATNAAGLMTTYEVTLTGKDVTDPIITTNCTSLNDEVSLSNACQILIPNFTTAIIASDNCDNDVTITQSPSGGSLENSAHNMEHVVTITATDNAGLTSECFITLTGKDVIEPSLNTDCSDLNDNINLDENCQITIPNFVNTINASDNCDTDIEVTQTPSPGTIGSSHNMEHIVIITATDNAGLTDVCQFTLTAKDASEPVFTNCSNFDREVVLDNNCLFILDNYVDDVIAMDNCDNTLTITQSPPAGSLVSLDPNAVLMVEMSTTDDAGLTGTCFINLTGKDETPPTITDCNNNSQDVNLDDNCNLIVPNVTDFITVMDNCDMVTITQNPDIGEVLNSGHNMNHTIMITATDAANLSSSCSITLVGKDVTAPVINSDCNSLNRQASLNLDCEFTMPDLRGSLTATDACDSNPSAVEQDPAPGIVIASAHGREHPVTLSSTDAAGQVGICQVIITARDVVSPVARAKDITITLVNGTATIRGEDVNDNSSDECGIVDYSVSPDTFTEEGEYPVTLTVTDAAGQSSSHMSIVTVEGNVILPIALLNFSAVTKVKQSLLQWEIPRTSLANSFIVEWSTGSDVWDVIGVVEAELGKLHYDFIHAKPERGLNYYRLKQIENDGSIEYSHVVQTSFVGTAGEVDFYPNPTVDQVEIILPDNFDVQSPIEIRFYNVNGQLVQQMNLATATERLSMGNLPSGLYQVQLIQQAQKAVGRVVKMR